jgi:hypothetical protein
MKNLFSIILVAFVLVSCGALQSTGGKLRLVKTGNEGEVLVIEKSAGERPNHIEEVHLEKLTGSTIQIPSEQSTTASMLNDGLSSSEQVVPSNRTIAKPQDLLPDEDERIIQEALQAEGDANTSFWLFLSGLSSAFLPYLGIIPFIIGLIYYSRSRNSRYITQFGERRSNAATVLLVIDGVILLLWMFFIVLLVLLL